MTIKLGADSFAIQRLAAKILTLISAICLTVSCVNSTEQPSIPREFQLRMAATQQLAATQEEPAPMGGQEQRSRSNEDGNLSVEGTSVYQENQGTVVAIVTSVPPPTVLAQGPGEIQKTPFPNNEKGQPLGAGGVPITRLHPPGSAPLWQLDNLVARTHEASISVHKLIISPETVTVIYSIELSEDYLFHTVDEALVATLQGDSRSATLTPIMSRVLHREDEVLLGALSFGPYDSDSLFYALVIAEMRALQASSRAEVTIHGPWTIPVIKQHDRLDWITPSKHPHMYIDGSWYSDRRDVEVSFFPRTYQGDSAIGWITTEKIVVKKTSLVHFLVKTDGDVIEISERQYADIREHVQALE